MLTSLPGHVVNRTQHDVQVNMFYRVAYVHPKTNIATYKWGDNDTQFNYYSIQMRRMTSKLNALLNRIITTEFWNGRTLFCKTTT